MENESKTYSQADVDSIADKVRATEGKRYAELESRFAELESKYNELTSASAKAEFVANGGKAEAYADFAKVVGTKVDNWENVKKEKPYYFASGNVRDNITKIDERKEMKEMLESANGVIPGTIYKFKKG